MPLDDFSSLKAAFVIGTVVYSKWKAYFPTLFPRGLVGCDENSADFKLSFELGWLRGSEAAPGFTSTRWPPGCSC